MLLCVDKNTLNWRVVVSDRLQLCAEGLVCASKVYYANQEVLEYGIACAGEAVKC